jgi:hypothetical protein
VSLREQAFADRQGLVPTRVDPTLHAKWPQRFRPDGLGVKADQAESVLRA